MKTYHLSVLITIFKGCRAEEKEEEEKRGRGVRGIGGCLCLLFPHNIVNTWYRHSSHTRTPMPATDTRPAVPTHQVFQSISHPRGMAHQATTSLSDIVFPLEDAHPPTWPSGCGHEMKWSFLPCLCRYLLMSSTLLSALSLESCFSWGQQHMRLPQSLNMQSHIVGHGSSIIGMSNKAETRLMGCQTSLFQAGPHIKIKQNTG